MTTKPVFRFAERKSWCRVCNKELSKGKDKAVFWYSSANRGMHIIICESCVKGLSRLVDNTPEIKEES